MVYFHDVFFSMPEMQEYYRLKDKAAQVHKEAMERAQEEVVPALIEKYKPLLLQFFPKGADVEFQGEVYWVPYYQDHEMGDDIPEHLTGEITIKYNGHIITWNTPQPCLEVEHEDEDKRYYNPDDFVWNMEPEVKLENVRLYVDDADKEFLIAYSNEGRIKDFWYSRSRYSFSLLSQDKDPRKVMQALLSQLDEKKGDTENV